jgi:fido (protein-threonine AMPylation protein)
MTRLRKRRIVNNPNPSGSSRWYLVEDFRVRGKRGRTTKYIGSESPKNEEESDRLRKRFFLEMEQDAIDKKSELSTLTYRYDLPSMPEVASSSFPATIRLLERLRFTCQSIDRILATSEIDYYEGDIEARYVHGTTFIEGNTLSLRDTYRLLKEGIAPKDKSLREINEVQNYRAVRAFREKYKGKVDLAFIRKLHSLIMNNIDFESAGKFRRTDDIGIFGSELKPTPASMIEDELQEAIDDYYHGLEEGQYPFFLAVILHQRFESIHPFTDGNGRVGREVFNYLLLRDGMPRLIFLGKDREVYLQALQKGDEGDVFGMIMDFSELMVNQRLKVAEDRLRKLGESIKADSK